MMMSTTQTWLLLILFILITNLSTLVQSQNYWCFNDNGNYTINSTYNNNLNTVLTSLSSNISYQGFTSASSLGQIPDRAHATAFCRADTQPGSCRTCVQNATTELRNLCPNQRQAVLWREFCTLRYSNVSILGNRADLPAVMMHNTENASSPDRFNEELRTLLDGLSAQAAGGGPLIKVAAGNRTAPDFGWINGMLECTPDISSDDCSSCLNEAAGRLPRCCANARGARILQPSCILRYETYTFYNLTRIQEAQAAAVGPSPPPLPPPPPPVPSPPGTGDDNITRTIIIVVVVIIVSLITATCVGIFLRKRIKQKPREIIEDDDEMSTIESLQYDFGKIRAATNDFSDDSKLGEGGFGAVYKGKLQNGQEIAVKRLSRGSGQGNLEFKNEVLLMARLQHRNLVRLLGFALEGTERLLVYEFVENASLDHFIFDPVKRSYIDWDKRYKIIGGIARGLVYLHEDSRLRIIHRDLKAANILLDGEMNPKIADFGMARLFEMDESEGNTSRVVGTYGYMAPEYAMQGQFSVKSDVFSYGVLMLEIISGQKNNSFQNDESVEDMLSFAWTNWREGTVTNMIDPILRDSSGSLRDMLRCIHIGLLCVQQNVADMPTMASVVIMLNSFSITLPVPSHPAFFVSRGFSDESSLLEEHNSRELEYKKTSYSKSNQSSKNDVSMSELYPR